MITSFCFVQDVLAQTATLNTPVSIGRNNCGSGTDSVYFFGYVSPNMTRATFPNAYRPRLKIGPSSTTNRFTISLSSISFNPKDQKLYFLWTTYTPSTRTYVWRWRPDTTFATSGALLDTVRSFPYDMAGVAFDNTGLGWAIEFPAAPCSKAYLRPIDFAAGIYNIADTLDFTTGPGGIGDTLFNVGSGDITMIPNGQMYYNYDNKLYTPDYQSWGGPTRHIKATYIDTTRLPSGSTSLVGLAYADGDIVSAYSNACTYRRLDPITADTNFVSYTYASTKGVRSVDMTQIIHGIGAAKRLISVTPTGTPNQYDVVYDVFVQNMGNRPVLNIQVKDSLGRINTNANVSNVTAVFTNNPAGLTLNAGYNGTTNVTLLNPATQTLPNYPASNNNFTIRISCRLSNILSGVVYNNSAVATGTAWNSVALRDSSTNGSTPDLNQNGKPDDVGESQPTPFVIVLTPTTPPCGTLSQVLYTNTFGTGVGLSASLPASPSMSTQYTGTATQPVGTNRFSITNNANLGNLADWISLTDHTGDVNGRMMVVNADAPANVFYRDTLPVACPGQQYSMSFWTAFLGNATYQVTCNGLGGFKYPKFLIRMRDLATGLTITQFTTANITSNSWQQLGMKWVMPAGYTNVIMEMLNAGPGGCGNDFAIDDVQYGICDPVPTVSVGTGCVGLVVTFTSSLSDTTVVPGSKVYQWQVASALAGPYSDIAGATSSTYTINPVTPADTGKYYRVIMAASGNMAIIACRYTSPGVKLSGKMISFAATSATKNKDNICAGFSVNLGITGGSLGTGGSWKWYSGSCGGTLVGTGSSISVSPTATTTYYVRAEGDCNNTACQQVTITINCNVDEDQDGIPDWVESNLAAAFLDVNPANGVMDAYDAASPGYADNNNDYVNDIFQAEGDSDNDGIPNYLDATFPGRIDSNTDGVDDRFDVDLDGIINMRDLDSDNDGIPDVVEAYGVDTNGDGKIDNFSDTDGDGLSQNVDANNTGASNTGTGLNRPDFDGDGVPNYIDLDSDNDGIPDLIEAGASDANNNGRVDGFTDANLDGIHDAFLNAGALLLTGSDGNTDGRADTYPNKNLDYDAKPNAYDMDADGDGIVDVIEAGLPDANLNGIVDGALGTNGWSTTVSAMPGPLTIRSTDGDGKADYVDIDSDDDGIPDNIEGMSTAGYLMPVTTDTDGDGLANTYDNVVGYGGSGIFVYDHDFDGTPDYRDTNSDGDSQLDIIEGNDFNLNGLADDNVTLTGLDTDNDGLDNRFDSLNSTTNVKGTSYRMGTGGTFTGDATPGARCTVTRKYVPNTDRDWRFVGVVLPVEFLQLTGVLQADRVQLNWTIIASREVDHFEVERSTDNVNYIRTGTVTQPVLLNQQQSFGFNDDVSSVNKEIIYYRIKVISKAGDIQYSNILVVRKQQNKTQISILPNPARDYVGVIFFAEKESDITIRLIDNLGKIVLLKNQRVTRGTNTLQLNGLSKYSNGVYSLQLFINEEAVTQKIIIAN
ncbi:MAG: T9SS type A sorting domain-containing protein [Chitinophagaceae bacterium]|nr:T9SS type A sorting domain-containing protein [Chitinophagaceae bacterium]